MLPRNKWFRKSENVKIGDLVLELNSQRKRLQWEMALMVDTYPGEDGLDRNSKVRIRNQNGKYDRPILKLCVIDTKQELCGEEQQ